MEPEVGDREALGVERADDLGELVDRAGEPHRHRAGPRGHGRAEAPQDLVDRVGIIDAGHIVAEGTPESLKAEIGRPSVEAVPADRADRDAVAQVLSQFGSVVPAPPGAAAVRLETGEDLVAVVRALDAADVAVADLQLHQPSLDDVFLAKTGRKLEAGDEPTPQREELAA